MGLSLLQRPPSVRGQPIPNVKLMSDLAPLGPGRHETHCDPGLAGSCDPLDVDAGN